MIVTSPVIPLTIAIVILIFLAVLFAFLEVKKKQRYRTIRLMAITVMMISIAGLLLRPKYTSTKYDSVLLLTAGYSKHVVDSILKVHPDLSVMYLSNAQPLKSATLLPEHDIANQNIHFVVGEGLSLHQMDKLNDLTFNYVPSISPEGLVGINVKENYESHRIETISGVYNNKLGRTSISLNGPAGVEDSINILEKGLNNFSLSFHARHPGNFIYTLTVRDTVKVAHENVPINVSDSRKLEILFLQFQPTFETQYLKSFVSKKKHKVIVRSQLSKNNFRNEFVNRETIPVARITQQLLATMDLVVADATSLSKLSPNEQADLEASVKMGLGLLTLPPIDKTTTGYFPFETITVRKDTTVISVADRSIRLNASPIRVKLKQSVIPLLRNKSGVLNGYTFNRAGKIGFQLLHETYQLTLAGDSLAYSEIWVPLLEKVSRRKEENSTIKILTPFPWYEDEPIDVEVLSSTEKIKLTDDSISVALRENVVVDNVWHGRTWGSNKGWHTLMTDGGAVRPYYIQSRPAWNTLSITNQMRANSLKSKGNLGANSNQITTLKNVPPVIFYLALILTAGYIWLAPRL